MYGGSNEIDALNVIRNKLFAECGVLDNFQFSKDKDLWSEDKYKDL